MLRLTSAGQTDQGRVRKHNEDAFLDAPAQRLWAVADGMGGHTAGDVASSLIVQRLGAVKAHDNAADFVDTVDDTLGGVNAELLRIAKERNVRVIGATVVVLLASKDLIVYGWAGDSRVYCFHGNVLERMSQDHSSAQEMVDTGMFTVEQLRNQPAASAITRAVGGEPKLVLDWKMMPFELGARFLLCSDGLTKELDDSEIEAELRKKQDAKATVAALIGAALERGGRDNVTALVVDLVS